MVRKTPGAKSDATETIVVLRGRRRPLHGVLHRRKLGAVERRILEQVTLGDTLLAHLVAGGSRHNRKRIAKHLAKKRASATFSQRRALKKLHQRGLIYIEEVTGGGSVQITDSGKELLRLARSYNFSPPTSWDKQWRMVFFDIPNDHKDLRQELRRLLEGIGFVHMQQSVYVFPYRVPALEEMLRQRNFLSSQVAYCTTTFLLEEVALKKHFKLA